MQAQSFMPLFGGFGWLAVMLILGVILRAKIGFFQKYLFPASIIGGIIGFILISVGWCNITHETFTLFAIHLFTLNFISIGLTGFEDTKRTAGSSIQKTIFRGMLWMACLWAALYSLQGLISVGLLFVTNTFSTPIYEGIGYLVPSGFAQGPGQAVALASVWQGPFKIPDAISFGLTFAAVGFLVASFVGVPLANWGIRKGLTVNAPKELPRDFITGLAEKGKGINAGQLTTHPGNIDGLAFQLAILMAVYFLTYYECLGLQIILPKTLKPLAFGLMFMWGMITAVIIRWLLGRIGLSVYIDNNVQRRITGVAVDFMIVATLMAVQVAAVWANIIPIVVLCLASAIFTPLFLIYFARRLDEFSFERFIAIFGTGTGTAASALLLLRIVDPEFKTPVAQEIGLMNIFLLLLIPTSIVTYTLPKIGLGTGVLISVIIIVVSLILLKVLKLWKKPAW
ncbi:MAG: sodium/glutamate symporter [bacterium]